VEALRNFLFLSEQEAGSRLEQEKKAMKGSGKGVHSGEMLSM
jgi:hypothetical protein